MCQKVKCLLKVFLVGRDGVEPPQEYPADLQSVELATCTASPLIKSGCHGGLALLFSYPRHHIKG